MSTFPLECPVLIHGIVKAPELNGKQGVVKSTLASNGRYTVFIRDADKSVALKPTNLKLQERTLDSLSVKDLKSILNYKSVEESKLRGADKDELRTLVQDAMGNEEEELALVIARANAPKQPQVQSTSNISPSTAFNSSQAADIMGNLSPEQLRQEARAMRSMPPDQIRQMSPQLRNMTDAQILQAASQMEMMANNPAMVRMATEQVRNMSPEQVQALQSQLSGNATTASNATTAATMTPNLSASSSTSSSPTPDTSPAAIAQSANMMASMTPEQLQQQAQMMRSMDPDQLRRMSPQLAHMSDEQLKMAASQFETMANNPAMLNMAVDQMKNMDAVQMEQLQRQYAAMAGNANGGSAPSRTVNSTASSPLDAAMGDPSKMLENMDGKQLKQMLNMLKENPEMLKQAAAAMGVDSSALSGDAFEQFANLDEAKLDKAIKVMATVQKAKNTWTNLRQGVTNGGRRSILLLGLLLILVVMVIVFVYQRWSSTPIAAVDPIVETIGSEPIPVLEDQDEFGEL